jgi:competence protein ComEC
LFILLQLVASLPVSWIDLPSQAVSVMLIAGLGVLLLLGPRGWPARPLGLILVGAMVFTHRPLPADGEFWLDMLDVGEGLAIVIRTREHALVFDAGPAFGPNFDTGHAVILPWLRYEGVDHIDSLVVSHGDNDHIGGAGSLLSGMGVSRILTSVPGHFDRDVQPCMDGDSWQWDGVSFHILHPPQSGWPFEGNNSSCVLLVENEEHSLLITGDIESMAEFRLGKAYPDLTADILVVPHHGSRTSSTAAFLDQLKPEYALVSTGYRNRFGFPSAEIVERYAKSGISLFNTSEEGSIRVHFPKDGPVMSPEGYIDEHLRYWHSARISTP